MTLWYLAVTSCLMALIFFACLYELLTHIGTMKT